MLRATRRPSADGGPERLIEGGRRHEIGAAEHGREHLRRDAQHVHPRVARGERARRADGVHEGPRRAGDASGGEELLPARPERANLAELEERVAPDGDLHRDLARGPRPPRARRRAAPPGTRAPVASARAISSAASAPASWYGSVETITAVAAGPRALAIQRAGEPGETRELGGERRERSAPLRAPAEGVFVQREAEPRARSQTRRDARDPVERGLTARVEDEERPRERVRPDLARDDVEAAPDRVRAPRDRPLQSRPRSPLPLAACTSRNGASRRASRSRSLSGAVGVERRDRDPLRASPGRAPSRTSAPRAPFRPARANRRT